MKAIMIIKDYGFRETLEIPETDWLEGPFIHKPFLPGFVAYFPGRTRYTACYEIISQPLDSIKR